MLGFNEKKRTMSQSPKRTPGRKTEKRTTLKGKRKEKLMQGILVAIESAPLLLPSKKPI